MSDNKVNLTWWVEESKRAKHRLKNRNTSAQQAWQEGFQAGLWYGKGGEATPNPYHMEPDKEE